MKSSASDAGDAAAGDDTLHAFVSYSHADRKVAAALCAYLERYPLPDHAGGLRVFFDETDIRSGELSAELGDALQRARSLIVCCSPSSIDSNWVEKEIEIFLAQGERVVVPIVLGGTPDAVVPQRLRARGFRYLDLRGRWLFGFLDPKGRIELARGIATILDCPLRHIVDWERRRQRRFALAAGITTLGALLVAAFFPLDYLREYQLADVVGAIRSLEFAEVRDDALLITAREKMVGPMGDRNYVAFYPDVLSRAASKWLGVDRVEFRTRLMPADPYTHACRRGAGDTLAQSAGDEAARLAAQRARQQEAEGHEPVADFAPRGPWIGAPVAGLKLVVCVVPPVSADPVDLAEGYVAPPAGDAIVAVGVQGREPVIARVEGLDPHFRPSGPRSIDVSRMLPVAASTRGLWLGMRARDDGRIGGLWHSTDGGRSWTRVKGFVSVGSIVVDPRKPDRVLVAKAPGRWKSGGREGVLAAEIVEQDGPGAPWRPLAPVPPFGTTAQIQLAGFFSDGALAVQVDGSVFELGRDHLARRVLGRYRQVATRKKVQ